MVSIAVLAFLCASLLVSIAQIVLIAAFIAGTVATTYIIFCIGHALCVDEDPHGRGKATGIAEGIALLQTVLAAITALIVVLKNTEPEKQDPYIFAYIFAVVIPLVGFLVMIRSNSSDVKFYDKPTMRFLRWSFLSCLIVSLFVGWRASRNDFGPSREAGPQELLVAEIVGESFEPEIEGDPDEIGFTAQVPINDSTYRGGVPNDIYVEAIVRGMMFEKFAPSRYDLYLLNEDDSVREHIQFKATADAELNSYPFNNLHQHDSRRFRLDLQFRARDKKMKSAERDRLAEVIRRERLLEVRDPNMPTR